MKPKNVLV